MDLTRLPISLSKVRSADKAAIEKDRKQFWDRLFEKVSNFLGIILSPLTPFVLV